MNRQESLRRRSGERPADWSESNETQLQAMLEDGNTKSFRVWRGRPYGVLAPGRSGRRRAA